MLVGLFCCSNSNHYRFLFDNLTLDDDFIPISDATLMIHNTFKHLKWAQGFNLSDYGDPFLFQQCCARSRPLHCIQVLSRPHGNVCLTFYCASIRQESLIRKHSRPVTLPVLQSLMSTFCPCETHTHSSLQFYPFEDSHRHNTFPGSLP